MFRHIGITAKTNDDQIATLLSELCDYLDAQNTKILLDERLRHFLDNHPTTSFEEIARKCDLVIVIGGDGTLLHSARILAPHDKAVIGVNRGRLGFLADISHDKMLASIEQILNGQYDEDPRFLIEAYLEAKDKTTGPILALNDVVLHKWMTARMIEFELWIDGRFVESQRSDGIIVSTPTGSTAYALSGGGPLIKPDLESILLVPICSHTLSNRPIIVSSSSTIELRLSEQTTKGQVKVTCDGVESLEPIRDCRIRIQKSPHSIRLLHPPGHDHFQILRNKLDWSPKRL